MIHEPIPAPAVGLRVAFRLSACKDLAGTPATICAVLRRFRGGAYLVTLEYDRPVQRHGVNVRHVEATWPDDLVVIADHGRYRS